jgi:acyl-CoA synthetase (AMP-forming)/AMP-acid ligase II
MVAEAYRDAPSAVVGPDRHWSGPELLARAAGAAAWLAELDLPPGAPVPAFFSATTGEAIAGTLGAAAIGRPLAPLAPRLTVPELTPVVAALHAPVIVADAGAVPLAERLAAATGARCALLPTPPAAPRYQLPEPAEDTLLGYLHTSGTTGAPKSVPLPQARFATRSRLNIRLLELDATSVYATASPWHHIGGSGNVLVAMAAGATIVEAARFGVEGWRELRARRPTHVLLVPSMIEMLLAEGLLEPGTLRVLQYGAAPIHPDTLRRVLDVLPGVRLVNLFGQTEGSPITRLGPADHLRARREPHLLRSVGRAVPGLELRIEGADVAGVGEVVARAEHLMRPDPDGWLRTGDLGRTDDEGFLYLAGRLADKIVRGGENVHPVEVENVLLTHPGVAGVGVVGVPERRLGETVAAFVVAADPAHPPSFDELRGYARQRLAGFKVPTRWRLVDELPRNAAGKLLRRELVD